MSATISPRPLTEAGRSLILVCAFLGWLCAGIHMSITQLVGQAAATDLLARTGELDRDRFQSLRKQHPKISVEEKQFLERSNALIGRWFAWYQCAFLFGAATGGLVFGRLGDRIGRARAMAFSILTYSGVTGIAYFASSPSQLLVCWFIACTGVGGMWPNGVALVSEAWSGMSRPMVAGLIGTSANI